jgi:hypothetical protein
MVASNLSCQTKISQLKHSIIIDQNVVWLDVPVYNSILVQVLHSFQKLPQNILKLQFVENDRVVLFFETLAKVIVYELQ